MNSGDSTAERRSGLERRSNRYPGSSDSKVLKERLSEARRQARLADQERRAADERASDSRSFNTLESLLPEYLLERRSRPNRLSAVESPEFNNSCSAFN